MASRNPVEPGTTARLSYQVWAAPGQDADCTEPGTYRFEPPFGSFEVTVSDG